LEETVRVRCPQCGFDEFKYMDLKDKGNFSLNGKTVFALMVCMNCRSIIWAGDEAIEGATE
jgi:DNA-directed RNA polymerase subunit RPC12/RpoP